MDFEHGSWLTSSNQDEPKWVPHPRSKDTDVNPYRQEYVKLVGATA
jgi:1,2-dihydroxy-3-keto-5-methylthiopentene dioxygenase